MTTFNPNHFRLWQPGHFNVAKLLEWVETGRLSVPEMIETNPYRVRGPQWQTALIESLILQAPIGPILIICNPKGDAGTDTLVDGVARVNAIRSFLADEWAFGKSRYYPHFEGKKASDMGYAIKRRILGNPIRIIGMEPEMPRDMMDDFTLRVMGNDPDASIKVITRIPKPGS